MFDHIRQLFAETTAAKVRGYQPGRFSFDAAQRDQIGAALRHGGVDYELVTCPGAGHAFFWPGTPAFSREATEETWARILALLAG